MKKIVKLSKPSSNHIPEQRQEQQRHSSHSNLYQGKQKTASDEYLMEDDMINCSFESDQDLKRISRRYQDMDEPEEQRGYHKQSMKLRSSAPKNQYEKNYDLPNQHQQRSQSQQNGPKIKPFHLQNQSRNSNNQKYMNESKLNSKYTYDSDSEEEYVLNKYPHNISQNNNYNKSNERSKHSSVLEREFNRKNYSQQNTTDSDQFECDEKASLTSLYLNQRDFDNLPGKLNEKRSYQQILPKKPSQQYENQFIQSQKNNEFNDIDQNSLNNKFSKKLIVKKSILSPPQSQLLQVQEKLQRKVPDSPVLPQKTVSNAANSPIEIDSMNKLFEEKQIAEIQGSFELGHQPLSMELCNYEKDQYLVEWKNVTSKQFDSVRIKPKSTLLKLSEIKKNAPEFYLQFLENQFGSFQRYKFEKSIEVQDKLNKKQFQDNHQYVIKAVPSEKGDQKQGDVIEDESEPVVDEKVLQNPSVEVQNQRITPSCFNCDKEIEEKRQDLQDALLFENKEDDKVDLGEQEYQPDIENKRYSPLLKSQVADLPDDLNFEENLDNKNSNSIEQILPNRENQEEQEEQEVIVEEEVVQPLSNNTQVTEQISVESVKDNELFEENPKENQPQERKDVSFENIKKRVHITITTEESQQSNNYEVSEVQQKQQHSADEEMQIEENENRENGSTDTEMNNEQVVNEVKTISTEKMMEKLSVNTELVLQTPEKQGNSNQEQEVEPKEKKVVQIDLDTYQDDCEDEELVETNLNSSNSKHNSGKSNKTVEDAETQKFRDSDDLFEAVIVEHHNTHPVNYKDLFEPHHHHSVRSRLEVIPEAGNDSESDHSCQNKLINTSIKSSDKQNNSKLNQNIEIINDDSDNDSMEEVSSNYVNAAVRENGSSLYRLTKVPFSDLGGVKAARKSAPFQMRRTNYTENSDEENMEELNNQELSGSLLNGSLGRFKSRTERTSMS